MAGLMLAGGNAAGRYKQARKAEKAGDVVRAFLLYAQAAAMDPEHTEYWARSQALRTQALLESSFMPADLEEADAGELLETDVDAVVGSITAKDLDEARRPQPPVELLGAPGVKDFDLKGDARQLYEEVARAFGLDVVFDGDFQPGSPVRLRIDDAGYRQALRIVAAATGCFLTPVSERLFLVANDTTEKRRDLANTMAIVIPIPEPVTAQEVQELARAVQQLMEIQKLTVDSQRRMVLIRDQVSKVRAAQQILEQLLNRRPEVAVDVEFLEVIETSSLRYGLRLQSSFPVAWLSKFWNATSSIPQGIRFATFGGGATLFGLGLADAELFASMTRSSSQTLLKSTIRSVSGQPATLHVGDKYPVMTAGYFGPVEGPGKVYTPPPTFNFEDLGVALKVTPYVHGTEEVTLEVEAEFKVLAGETLNGIPIIANRKFQGVIRLRNGEWALMAGLVRSQEVRSITGIVGLSRLPVVGPLFRQNRRESESGQMLLILKPRLLNLPPTEMVTHTVWTGTESRPRAPI